MVRDSRLHTNVESGTTIDGVALLGAEGHVVGVHQSISHISVIARSMLNVQCTDRIKLPQSIVHRLQVLESVNIASRRRSRIGS